jgi:hypothetical protein
VTVVRAVVLSVAVALPSLLWAAASPLSSGADEPAHVIRAASLARGQLVGTPITADPDDPRTAVTVPEVIGSLPEPACYAGHPEVPADCAGPLQQGTPLPGGGLRIETTSGRHPPGYYALAGLPYLAYLPTAAGNHLPRILSALACAAFLAVALAIAGRASPPAVVGVLAALPPMALHLTGLVNPNGLEIAAAVCLWTATLALGRADPELPPSRGLLAAAGLSGTVLTLTRPASALWLALIVLAAAAVARPGVLRALLRDRAALVWAGVGALAAAASTVWLAVVGNPVLEGGRVVPEPQGLVGALRATLARTPLHLQEMIGILGWLDTVLPAVVQRVWLTVVVALVLAAILARRRRHLAVLAAVAAATVLVPAALEAARYADLGMIWQGRYTLPLAAGVPILAGFALAGARSRLAWALAVPAAVLLAGGQVVAYAFTLRRYVVGIAGPLNFLGDPGWQPPLSPAVLLVAYAAAQGLLLLALGWWTATTTDA